MNTNQPYDNPYDPQPTHHQGAPMQYSTGSFTRVQEGKMVAGICQAISDRFGWDVNLIRAGTAIGAVITSGTVLLIYLIVWAIIPMQGAETTALNEAMKKGQQFYDNQKAKEAGQPGAQPGPTPQTPRPGAADPDPFDLYKD